MVGKWERAAEEGRWGIEGILLSQLPQQGKEAEFPGTSSLECWTGWSSLPPEIKSCRASMQNLGSSKVRQMIQGM